MTDLPQSTSTSNADDVDVTNRSGPLSRIRRWSAAARCRNLAAAHRLVTVGDSLTHGVSSGAVFAATCRGPQMVARCLGVDLPGPGLRRPARRPAVQHRGAAAPDGGRRSATTSACSRGSRLPSLLQRIVDANEDYWERGAGPAPPPTDPRYDNVGIYGWDVRDALSYTDAPGRRRALAASSRRPPRRPSPTTTTTSPPGRCWRRSAPTPPRSTPRRVARRERRDRHAGRHARRQQRPRRRRRKEVELVRRRLRRPRPQRRLQRLAPEPLRPGVRRAGRRRPRRSRRSGWSSPRCRT